MDGPQVSPQGAPQSQPGVPPSFRVPPPAKPWPTWLRITVPVVILALGAAVAAGLVLTKPTADKKEKPKTALPVEVVPLEVGEHPVVVRAQGTVRAARQVVLQPEITGRVTWLSDELVPGGRLRKGQPLVRINPRDYQLAVQQQQAQVASQALALRVENARKGVAEREWELYQAERAEREQHRVGKPQRPSQPKHAGTSAVDAGSPSPDDVLESGKLALREPHVKSAEIALKSARSGLSQAQLLLSRTTLVAPFNALVQAEAVDAGQLISPASQLATLVGTDAYWVQVALPVEQLAHLELPRNGEGGSPARVWFDAGEERVEREGTVIRLLGDLDPVGRMARVLVEIEDPLGLEDERAKAKSGNPKATPSQKPPPQGDVESSGDDLVNGDTKLPLLLGSFVNVEIRGKTLANVAEIPTRALQPGDRVYLLGEGDKLMIRRVQVLLRTATTTVVRGDLSDGDKLIVTSIDTPVEGMALRVSEPAPDRSAAASAASAAPTADESSEPATSATASTGASP